ncbi:hypothetical protein SEVIR_7G203700v4 [Setaria viridis]|uniref:Uncharacterized protein n=2 Tax=Setaria TaxID=4554 RepID=A0A368RXD7_SETIT|nr:hypothetical protein SETIT_7G191600v2 [Setaria italica]TKW05854.1 hypothetical protein SEVIR_7G203700v2 [Setaria viridis]
MRSSEQLKHEPALGFGNLQWLSSPLHAEATAAPCSVERAVQRTGKTHVAVETDASILGEALNSQIICLGQKPVCVGCLWCWVECCWFKRVHGPSTRMCNPFGLR